MKKSWIFMMASVFPTLLMAKQEQKKPNVLFILVDDFGCCDLSCTGSTFYESPHVDQLMHEGMNFSQAYAACPVSSPSRGAIMTGKYPGRTNITDWIPGNRAFGPHKDQKLKSLPFSLHLSSSEKAIASTFKENGYKTFFAGKWHLAEQAKDYPDHFGFDINKGGNKSGHPASGYFAPYFNPELPDGEDNEYLTDRLTNEAIQFIKANKHHPFFAYVSYYTVHMPLQAKADKVEKYKKKLLEHPDKQEVKYTKSGVTYFKQSQDNPIYAAMIESMDENIGRLLQLLKDLDIDKNTIIVFTSDNGGMSTSNNLTIPTSNLPYRAGKGYLYEGGIKVPAFIKWSGKIPSNRECNVPVIGTDFYPTLLDLCEIPLNAEQHKDGSSLKPLLFGGSFSRDAIYWHYPHYSGGLGGRPSAAIRCGEYKLIEFFEDNHVELYNLQSDISEQYNLVNVYPKLVLSLKKKLHDWYREVNAQMPVPNEAYIDDK